MWHIIVSSRLSKPSDDIFTVSVKPFVEDGVDVRELD
jgi:hypothetical protein